ncbi:hypothetical protein WEU38_00290 [Cyanobacterium aponinum AL20118]|uniref:Uncharacterized protein n=1 Tax=Cyanobacterium aponinum AL20115 TaxID=3090662 RepID=A0AAF1C6D9_9CHRO|nr:hypothetical protein [Cyanobacterium aponinum]PHV63918.1 hypothetical protein CSQ80_02515 [Cyanobacterium aponinum IPPAS B-1201]WPF88749.1 hypothetical protein SAY89_00295 [Cyanobacterium aponinum AL20115]
MAETKKPRVDFIGELDGGWYWGEHQIPNYVPVNSNFNFDYSLQEDLLLPSEFFYNGNLPQDTLNEVRTVPSFFLGDNSPPDTSIYINAPTLADPKKINPLTTRIFTNDFLLTHRSEWELQGGYSWGEETISSPNFNSIWKLKSEVRESLRKDRVFTVDQVGSYLHLGTVRDTRQVITTQVTPVTLIGQELQMSLTGECIASDAPPNSICTYTPGLETDRNSIDPKSFVPLNINTTSNFGDIVTPKSLDAIAQPGFQQGADNQKIGLNLYFPNSGVVTGNSQGSNIILTRKEEFTNALAGSYIKIRQIVQANGEKAAIARTVKGVPIISNQDNNLLYSGLSFLNLILPELEPNLKASENTQPIKSSANRNLFFAANNSRLPSSSFVIYQAGKGEAMNTPDGIKTPDEIPPAYFNNIWFGLSPVIARFSEVFEGGYEIMKPIEVVESGGGEGGEDIDNIDFSSVVNDDFYSNNTLTSPYLQVYFTFFNQEATVAVKSIYSEKINYYPHLSFTGNITNNSSIFRYYFGAIFANDLKPYVGLDYTKNYNDWNYRIGGVGYLNSDQDYYSQINGNINYQVTLEENSTLTFYTAFQYALQNTTYIGDTISVTPLSEISLGTRLNVPKLMIGITNFWGLDNLENNSRSKMLVNIGINVTNYLYIGGYFAPYDQNSSRTRYGMNLNLNLDLDYNTPQLIFSWTNYEYNYGLDILGNQRSLSDNVFRLTFRIGQPNNPFR